nr:MAG TPA: hypothetical protein [Bacteriophage sp.]
MVCDYKISDFIPKGIHWGSSPQREQRKINNKK